MSVSWYAITITDVTSGDVTFSGVFSVDNTSELVTGFYENIGGSIDYSNNIFANKNFYRADNKFQNGSFTPYGTIISSMNYYSSSNPSYEYFRLIDHSFIQIIEFLDASEQPVGGGSCNLRNNTNFRSILFQ